MSQVAAQHSAAVLLPTSTLSLVHALGSEVPRVNGLQPLRRLTPAR